MSVKSTIKYGSTIIVDQFEEPSDSVVVMYNGSPVQTFVVGDDKFLNTAGKLCSDYIQIGSKILATKDKLVTDYIEVIVENAFSCTLTVNSVANSTVIATSVSSNATYTTTADANGVAIFTITEPGTYSITSTGTSRVATAILTDQTTEYTAYYSWQKWNSVLTYSQNSYYVGGGGSFWTGSWVSAWTFSSGYSFNSSTGQFILSGGSSRTLRTGSSTNMVTDTSNPYVGYPSTGATTSNVCPQVAYAANSMQVIRANTSGFVSPSGFISPEGAYVLYSTGTYSKGSTQYANATGTNLNTYPDNGRASDGYWYIAI